MKKQNYNKGFTLLFASLVGALVIAVGMAILSITLKQIALSSAGKATQQAFYTADAATECAVFLNRGANGIDNDGNQCYTGFFPDPDGAGGFKPTCLTDGSGVPEDSVVCMGKKIIINGGSAHGYAPTIDTYNNAISTFVFDESLSPSNVGNDGSATNNDMCFTVDVTKTVGGGGTEPETIIQTRGYNTCKNVPNRFERAIRSVTKTL